METEAKYEFNWSRVPMQELEGLNNTQAANLKNITQSIFDAVTPLDSDVSKIVHSFIQPQHHFVLLGECTHGTEEFYHIRKEITKYLVTHHQFKIVLLESDWPSLYRVNQYVTLDPACQDKNANEALGGIIKYPKWMWRNAQFLELVEWLREYNKNHEGEEPVRVLGMDCYQMLRAKDLILDFLKVWDRAFHDEVERKLQFMSQFKTENEYGFALVHGSLKNHAQKVEKTLESLLAKFQWEKMDQYTLMDGMNLFELIMVDQCFEVLVNGDEYYRKMYSENRGSQATWNCRDQHMTTSCLKISELYQKLYNIKDVKMVLWAHNSHIGDSLATYRGGVDFQVNETWNLGQMVRKTFGEDKTRLIGFYTHHGYVRASHQWDGPDKKFKLNPALRYSSEWFFHMVSKAGRIPSFIINFDNFHIEESVDDFKVGPIPAVYRVRYPDIKVTRNLDPNSEVLQRDLEIDETFTAVERKITAKGYAVRLRLDNGGWITEFMKVGSVRHYCVADEQLHPEDMPEFFNTYRLQRWIGVNYKQDTECQSHYGETAIAKQYDTVIYFDGSSDLRPLRKNLTNFKGIKRLQQEYKNILRHPVENVLAHPNESNLFEWYFVIIGIVGTPYDGGYYLGKLIFPKDFPLKPPKIMMITPNGRFDVNTAICLSMSSFHPELWNPTWTVESILMGLYSFMLEDTPTTGSVNSTIRQKRQFATQSMTFNRTKAIFMELFSEDVLDDNGETKKLELFGTAQVDSTELICRYCLKEEDTEDNLIAPCKCAGTSKWTHLECLQNWQRSVLINQSTNPRFQTDIDKKCNVCMTNFNVKPLDRKQAILDFAGSEIANALVQGCFIVSDRQHSKRTEKQMKKPDIPDHYKFSVNHWLFSIFIITQAQSHFGRESLFGVNLTNGSKTIPSRVVVDRRWINLGKLWRQKYKTIWKMRNIDFTYFIGGPCRPEIAYAIGFCSGAQESDEISIVYATNRGQQLIYGKLEHVVEAMERKGTCYVFSGYAGWERTQLLAEMSRRHWWVAHGSYVDCQPKSLKGIWERIADSRRCIQPAMSEYNKPKFDDSDEE